MSIRMHAVAGLIVLLGATTEMTARGAPQPFPLRFNSQEGVQSTTVDFDAAILERSFDLRVVDGRKLPDPTVVGQGTDGDDRKFPIKTESDLASFLKETLTAIATDWGLAQKQPADRTLLITVTRFHLDESNKALGSMYKGEVKFTFTLQDAAGKVIDDGSASGTANRYGRAVSIENYNEVLSDAVKDAFANVLSDAGLQAAWASGRGSGATSSPASPSGATESVEERLRKLDELLQKKLITKDEYDKTRAKILADM